MFPDAFIRHLREDFGKAEADRILKTLELPVPTSVRINPSKITVPELEAELQVSGRVVTSDFGFFLEGRPLFTTNPLYQCGCWYVQEAGSMVLEHFFSEYSSTDVTLAISENRGLRVLDLCAAPGGKSTHLLTLLRHCPAGSFLVSNEVISSRATVLGDNIVRWGATNVAVTNNDPADFGKLEGFFDVILIDAPCSGEGMFRKDERAVAEWSEENVRLCAARQRRIVADAIRALRPGGLLLYSTCTFNRQENEDNTEWFCGEFGMEILEQRHLFPGEQYGEGLFMAALRQKRVDSGKPQHHFSDGGKRQGAAPYRGEVPFIAGGYEIYRKGDLLKAYPKECAAELLYVESKMKAFKSGCAAASLLTDKRGNVTLIPEPDIAFSEALKRGAFAEVELNREDALRYMKCETMSFPEVEKGYLLLTCKGHPLGFVKNIGPRANSLWPASRRIRLELPHIVDER